MFRTKEMQIPSRRSRLVYGRQMEVLGLGEICCGKGAEQSLYAVFFREILEGTKLTMGFNI